VTKVKEKLPEARLRPCCADDSRTKPVWERGPGEAVDLWIDDVWWRVGTAIVSCY
jgi:hypothetical protein